MDALDFFGHAIYFLIGAFAGAVIMYVGPLVVEFIDERTNKHGR